MAFRKQEALTSQSTPRLQNCQDVNRTTTRNQPGNDRAQQGFTLPTRGISASYCSMQAIVSKHCPFSQGPLLYATACFCLEPIYPTGQVEGRFSLMVLAKTALPREGGGFRTGKHQAQTPIKSTSRLKSGAALLSHA